MNTPHSGTKPIYTQLAAIMQHIPRYSCRGISRLAKDAGLNQSTLSRLIAGNHTPSFTTVSKIIVALEQALGMQLYPLDLVRHDLDFSRTPCEICRCRGCFPQEAFASDGTLVPAFQNIRPGQWTAATVEAAKGGE